MTDQVYTPRTGTKAATAAEALKNGPMNCTELGQLLDVPAGSVGAHLKRAIEEQFIVRVKDSSGLLHFALASNTPDDDFDPEQAQQQAPADGFNPADPFGLVARSRSPSNAAASVRISAQAPAGVAPPQQRTEPAKVSPRPAAKAKPAKTPTARAQDDVVSSMSVGGIQLILWRAGNLVISANDNTVDLQPDQARALRAFVGLMSA
jgi:hypothetical protein